jgi:hypothetical protein
MKLEYISLFSVGGFCTLYVFRACCVPALLVFTALGVFAAVASLVVFPWLLCLPQDFESATAQDGHVCELGWLGVRWGGLPV